MDLEVFESLSLFLFFDEGSERRVGVEEPEGIGEVTAEAAADEAAEIPRISFTLKASVPTIRLARRNLALEL